MTTTPISGLMPLSEHYFTHGADQLYQWCPSIDTPRNIIGLPRMLLIDNGRRLNRILGISSRACTHLLSDTQLLLWASHHGVTPSLNTKLIRAFFSNLRYRRHALQSAALAVMDGKPVHAAAKFSVDFCIVKALYPRFGIHELTLTTEQWKSITESLNIDADLFSCADDPYLQLHYVNVMRMALVTAVGHSLKSWSTFGTYDRERIILGLFALMTVTGSLAPVTWAIEQAPELVYEFAHFRPVYARRGRPRRAASQRQTIWIRRLWRKQITALRRQLLSLDPLIPTNPIDLHEQSRVLNFIYKARQRHRLLHVHGANP